MSKDMRTPFHLGAQKKRIRMVQQYLNICGVDADARNIFCKAALAYAAEKANFEMIEFISKFRPAVNTEANREALYTTLSVPMYDTLETLIDYGFKTIVNDRWAADVLHQTIEQGRFTAVKTLLDLGADIETLNRMKKGVTPLHTAVKHRQYNITELLLQRGADVTAKTIKGKRAICYAVRKNDRKITKLLLRGDAARTGVSVEHIYIAVKMGNSEIVETLLEDAPHIDIDARDIYGRTALHYTAIPSRDPPYSLQKVIILTRKEAARPEKANTRADMAKMFLARGVSANVRASEGVTPLHLAADGGYSEVAQILLEYGANVDAVTSTGLTALHLAASRNSAAVVMLLLNQGADVNVTDAKGRTPLHAACESGHAWLVPMLVERGASLEARDFEGRVPLHVCARDGYAKVIGMLLNLGANIEARDHSGKTALHHATINSKLAAVEILVENGADFRVTCYALKSTLDYACSAFDERQRNRTILMSQDNEVWEDPIIIQPQVPNASRFVEVICKPKDNLLSYEDFCRLYFDSLEDTVKIGQIIEMRLLATNVLERRAKGLAPVRHYWDSENIYCNHCRAELDRLSQNKIGNSNMTFYDLLVAEPNTLASYAKNSQIAVAMDWGVFGSEYPIYCEMLYRQFNLGVKRMDLLPSCTQSLNAISGCSLTDPIAAEIFAFLNNEDLINLSEVDPDESQMIKQSDNR